MYCYSIPFLFTVKYPRCVPLASSAFYDFYDF